MIIVAFCCTLTAQEVIHKDIYGNPVPKVLLNEVSIDLKNVSLKDALTILADSGKFHLNYSEDIIPKDKKVTLKMENVIAVKALRKILAYTNIDFTVTQSGQIVLIKTNNKTVAKHHEKYTISGYITDANNGEALIGTNVYVERLGTGCSTNTYGFYSLTLPAGYYYIKYSYMGYEIKEIEVYLFENIKKNMELKEAVTTGETITITAEIEDRNIKSNEMGTIRLAPQKLNFVPVLFGEQDILKTIQMLPGIASGREGDTGFYVRGGSSTQNLVLLDEAPVYNAYHFLGFFSVFNSEAIKNLKIYKGPAPPKFGGRLSSVLDIQMNEGNKKEFKGSAGIGMIFSRLTLQGPISKDKSSFMISARRTYVDLFLKMQTNEDVRKTKLYFYDYNVKTNYKLGEKDQLFLSGYFGKDAIGYSRIFNLYWGNNTATARWSHLFSDRLFLNTSLIYSKFNYEIDVEPEDEEYEYEYESEGAEKVNISSVIKDFNVKQDYQYFANDKNTFNFGLHYVYHTFLPVKIYVKEEDETVDMDVGKRNAHEGAAYFSHEYKATEKLKFDYGLRYSLFSVFGPGDFIGFDYKDDVVEIESYKKGDKTYGGFEPRLMMNYLLNKTSSIKFGYARNYQYIHMVSKTTHGTPLDIWQPSSDVVRPQRSDIVSLGYFRNFDNNKYEASVELYYKDLKNQMEYRNGANIFLGNLLESELIFGKGWAFGVEFFIKKSIGKLTGWLSYTLSRTMRNFGDINNNKSFPPKYDRTHDISFVGIYDLNDRWSVSANWVYFSGDAITIPCGTYSIDGHMLNLYTERNGYRLPAYHRLDIGISKKFSNGGSINFSLYNAYGRKNIFTILFRRKKSDPDSREILKLSLFSFFPSVTYNINF